MTAVCCKTTNKGDNEVTDIQSKNHHYDFNEFLRKFQIAVVENDTTALKTMTKFPLETRRDLDSDPIIKYNEKEFIGVFTDFLKRPSGNIENFKETQFDVLKSTCDLEPNQGHRIGDIVFEKVDNNWKLAFIYYWELK